MYCVSKAVSNVACGSELDQTDAYLVVVHKDLELISGLGIGLIDDFCSHCGRDKWNEIKVDWGLRWFDGRVQ
jgi:hypothetical protein